MNALKLRILVCFVFVALFVLAGSRHVMAQSLDKAIATFESGNHKAAYPVVRAYAEKGNARAQTILGIMYAKGKAVPWDDEEAVKWYRRGAEGGDGRGQYNLADRYYRGTGIEKNGVLAYVWFALSISSSTLKEKLRDKAERRLIRIERRRLFGDDLKDAEKLIKEWQSKFKSLKK